MNRTQSNSFLLRASILTIGLLAGGSSALAQQTIVDVTMMSNPVTPGGTAATNTANLTAAIASASPSTVFLFPAGTYSFDPKVGSGTPPHIEIKNRSNLTLRGSGQSGASSTIFKFSDAARKGISVESSANIRLEAFAIEYSQFAFTQGVVASLCSAGSGNPRSMDVAIDLGFPAPTVLPTKPAYGTENLDAVVVYDASGAIKRDTDLYEVGLGNNGFGVMVQAYQVSGSVYRIYSKQNQTSWSSENVQVGDRVSIKCKSLSSAIDGLKNNALQVRDVTIRMSSSAAVNERDGTSSLYEHVVIEPMPNALLSSNRDGLYLQRSRSGPTVRFCEIERTGDDGIALRGSFLKVIGTNLQGDDLDVQLECKTKVDLRVGDILRFAGAPSYETRSEVAVSSITEDWSTDSTSGYPIITVRLEDALQVAAFDLVTDLDMAGNGFSVYSNRIQNNRARGIFVKTSNGIVAGNRIANTTMAGILVGPQLDNGYEEAGFVENVIIANNEIRNVSSRRTDARHGGAISVIAQIDSQLPCSSGPCQGVNPVCPLNKNITIEGNWIDLYGRVGILMMNTHNGVVSNNHILNGFWNTALTNSGNIGMDSAPLHAVNLQKCEDVLVEGNYIETKVGFSEYYAGNCNGCSFVNNAKVLTTNFELLGSSTIPDATSIGYLGLSGPPITFVDEGISYSGSNWGLFGNIPSQSYARSVQCSASDNAGDRLEIDVSGLPTLDFIEFDLGADALNPESSLKVEIEDSSQQQIAGESYNTTSALNPLSSPFYFTRKSIVLPSGTASLIRFRRNEGGAGGAQYLYVDDIVFGVGFFSDQ